MKALVQRVSSASVTVQGNIVGAIEQGLCVFLGIHQDDSIVDLEYILTRLLTTKLWPDGQSGLPWKKSVQDMDGSKILVVSQFTLYSVIGRNGRAPDFHLAMKAEKSLSMFDLFVEKLRFQFGHDRVATGQFQAYMSVNIVNDGPVTIELESKAFKEVKEKTKSLSLGGKEQIN